MIDQLAAIDRGKVIAIVVTTVLIIGGAMIDVFVLGSEPTKKHLLVSIGHPLMLLPLALENRAGKVFTGSVILLLCADMWAIFFFGS